MNLFGLFRKKEEIDPLPAIESVLLEKTEEGVLTLSVPPGEPYYCNLYLWDFLQRDVILSLMSGLFVMVHLDGFAALELDEELQKACPCQTDGDGKSYLLAGEGLIRLATEMVQGYDEYWEYGELVHFSGFTSPPPLDFPPETDLRELPGYAVCIRPVSDDLGLRIAFSPECFPEEELTARIQQLAAGYRLPLEIR